MTLCHKILHAFPLRAFFVRCLCAARPRAHAFLSSVFEPALGITTASGRVYRCTRQLKQPLEGLRSLRNRMPGTPSSCKVGLRSPVGLLGALFSTSFGDEVLDALCGYAFNCSGLAAAVLFPFEIVLSEHHFLFHQVLTWTDLHAIIQQVSSLEQQFTIRISFSNQFMSEQFFC